MITLVENLYKILICHFMGDYVLQTDFLAQTKGSNWYHLIIHCFLYTLPFYVAFGFDRRLLYILIVHLIVDPLKARYHKIDYVSDQLAHFIAALPYMI